MTNEVTIYTQAGDIRATVAVEKGSERVFNLQTDDYVTLKFKTLEPIYFAIGDYADLADMGRFVITDEVKPTINKTTGGLEYSLKMHAPYVAWKNKMSMLVYKREVDGVMTKYRREAEWNLTMDIESQAKAAILDNLEVLGITYLGEAYTVDVDDTVSKESQLITYSQKSIYDAMATIAETFDCEWWVTQNVVHFGKCEFGGAADAVELIMDKNVSEMSSSGSSASLATRYYVFGSTENLKNYRKSTEGNAQAVTLGVVTDRLMLPEGIDYIDLYRYDTSGRRVYITDDGYNGVGTQEMPECEIVESTLVYDDIYPRTTCVTEATNLAYYVTDTDENTGVKTQFPIYQFKVKDWKTNFPFKKSYILDGEQLKIKFQSGLLNGMTFQVAFNPDNKIVESDGTLQDEAQLWEIVRNEDYGRMLPDETLKPADGDEVVFIGFDCTLVSERFVPNAEQELYDKAVEDIKDASIDATTYTCTLPCDTSKTDMAVLGLGQRVSLVNESFFKEPRQSRVIGWTIPVDIPQDSPKYKIGESVAYSRLTAIESKIGEVTANTERSEAKGSSLYVIRTSDTTTPATDTNVYSALRVLARFLRKTEDDTMEGLLTLVKGLQSDNFLEGTFGTGFELVKKNGNGNSYLEVDEMLVRLKATFTALEIKHVSHCGGEIILSPAGMECSEVKTDSGNVALLESGGSALTDSTGAALVCTDADTQVYRCRFKTTDGERTIYNQFQAGDLAYCREFNTTADSTLGRYYWRRVTAVGDDYIDLSIADCQSGSDAPMAGDTIVALGNVKDASRQNAVVISSYASDAPSMKMYQGIDSYELSDEHCPIIISPHGNKFTGDFISTSGENVLTLINDTRSEIKQTADELSLSIYSLGVDNRNYCVADKTAGFKISPTISLETGEIFGTSVRVGALLTDTLKAGDTLYLSCTAQAGKATSALLAPTLTMMVVGDGQTFASIPLSVSTSLAQQTTVTDSEIAVTAEMLACDSVNVMLVVGSAITHVSGTINNLMVARVKTADYAEAPEQKLVRTGIDVADRVITLQADTTEFRSNDGTTTVRIFSDEGKINASMIDADSITARRVEATSALGTITIEDGAMLMTDSGGTPKLKVTGGTLTEQTDSQDVPVKTYPHDAEADGEKTGIEVSVDLPADYGWQFDTLAGGLATFPEIGMYIGMSCYGEREDSVYQGRTLVEMGIYLDGRLIKLISKSGEVSEQTLSTTATVGRWTQALDEGTHKFTVKAKFTTYGDAPITSATFRVEVDEADSPVIRVEYPVEMVEIASDGFRAATANNTYMMSTQSGCEMRFQKYLFRVSAAGIQASNDGGVKWTNILT